MTSAVLKIERRSGGLGVRLPAVIVQAADRKAGQQVRVSVEDEHVVIRPLCDHMPTLEQRLARFDPERQGGEVV